MGSDKPKEFIGLRKHCFVYEGEVFNYLRQCGVRLREKKKLDQAFPDGKVGQEKDELIFLELFL